MLRLKLFPKIALILVCLAILPALVVGWQTAVLNEDQLSTNILELHTNLAHSLAERIDTLTAGIAGKARAAIETSRVQGFVSAAPLQALIDSNPEFISIAFVQAGGGELLKAVHADYPDEKRLIQHANEDFFKNFAAQKSVGGVLEPKYQFLNQSDEPRFAMLFPLDASRPERGSFYALVTLKEFWSRLASEGSGVQAAGRQALVVDEQGYLIAHSQPELMRDRILLAEHPLVREALQNRTVGSKEYADESGETIVGSYSRVPTTGWITVIQQEKKTAFSTVYETRRRAVRILLVSLLAASLAGYLLARSLSKPIFSVIRVARAVSHGNFDQRVVVDSDDEMADLAHTFNEMVASLKQYSELQLDRIMAEKTKTEAVIFSIADGIIMTDESGTIQLANDRAAQLLTPGNETPGDPESWTGKNLFDVFPDAALRANLRRIASNPDGETVNEFTLERAGRPHHYQVFTSPVRTPHTGRKIGVLTVVHDVTLERQLDQLKERFLHSITHDLRNPMTSIMGFLKFLRDGVGGELSEAQDKMVQTMQKAGTRLLNMINDILDIAKVEAGKMQIEPKPVAVAAVLEDALALYEGMAKRKLVKIELQYPQGVDKAALTLQADPNQFERVLGNLVGNALKFSPHEGQLTVKVDDFPDRMQFSVIDQGPGVPPQFHEKIFDKFQQVGEVKGGTGLGLTITKYFVELHRGKIWVESEVDRGATFVFWIPKGLAKSESGELVVRRAA